MKMAIIVLAALLLTLLSVGQSAPLTDCDSLTRRVEITGRDQLLGNWRHIGESSTVPVAPNMMKRFLETSWAQLTAADEPDSIIIKQLQKVFGRCFFLKAKATLMNSTLSFVSPFTIVEVFLTTSCPDCLVVSSNTTLGLTTYSGLQLLSRRDSVTPAELDEYRKQVKCLNLPDPVILNTERGYCLDDASVQDLTPAIHSGGTDVMAQMDELLKNKAAIEQLLQGVFNSLLPSQN
ncbi:uncharacterized protein LOC128754912 [Synchiropus splendidus]|uniref:uncharacterized protein LOC128754912 n=1 Tax=Synchiropus splendidus TaxID=270530 RepID=UPI00237E75A7|nr:uncharacterized protein LOC128754912 [Synchiropus splendidus]